MFTAPIVSGVSVRAASVRQSRCRPAGRQGRIEHRLGWNRMQFPVQRHGQAEGRRAADSPWRRCHAAQITGPLLRFRAEQRSEEHTSELQSLMRISYAVFCLKKKKQLLDTQNTKNI